MYCRNVCLALALAAAVLTSSGCNLCRKNQCSSSSAAPCCPPPPCGNGAAGPGVAPGVPYGVTPTQAYSIPVAPGGCNGR